MFVRTYICIHTHIFFGIDIIFDCGFQENIQYSVNLDIVSYEDDRRETHNPVGRAYAPVVWDYYQVSQFRHSVYFSSLGLFSGVYILVV